MHNPESVLENDSSGILRYKRITSSRLRLPDITIINIKERTYRIVDFAVSADHKLRLEESGKWDKYFDLAGELKYCET